MAWRGNQPNQEYLCCSICGDRLRDPVTIPCLHSYCKRCIENVWDGEDEEEIYSCPQCSRTFTPRPVLVVDTSTRLQQNIRPLRYHEEVMGATSRPTYTWQNPLSEEWTRFSLNDVGFLQSPAEPKTRAQFLKYLRKISFDPNTVFRRLSLSKGNRKVTFMREKQSHPTHPDRFTYRSQVLSTECLTGPCYWEVKWRGGGVEVAVAYEDINRKKSQSTFGNNEESWSLHYDNNRLTFRHNSNKTLLSGPLSSRIGVYLDHSSGLLSFYSVTNTMTLLHRVQTRFTQPLYAGVWLDDIGDTAELK